MRVKSDEDLWRRRAGPISFGLRGSARGSAAAVAVPTGDRSPPLACVSIQTVLYEKKYTANRRRSEREGEGSERAVSEGRRDGVKIKK